MKFDVRLLVDFFGSDHMCIQKYSGNEKNNYVPTNNPLMAIILFSVIILLIMMM